VPPRLCKRHGISAKDMLIVIVISSNAYSAYIPPGSYFSLDENYINQPTKGKSVTQL
jgi:hypothetical protein